MKIKHQAGEKFGNADALSRFETKSCPRVDCTGHKMPKQKLSIFKEQEILVRVLTLNQSSANESDGDCVVISQFMNLFIEHTEKPHAKYLATESSEVKILCSLWRQFKIVDQILYKLR